nr:transposase [Oscillospiraceae bacterium]
MKTYDYSNPNYYFITICTWEKKCIFGKNTNLNVYGRIAVRGLVKITRHFPSVRVEKFVVMPNHIHAILVLGENAPNLSVVVGQFKSFVSKQIHTIEPKKKVWQASFHDHVVRNQKDFERIWLYIESNPGNWEKDCFFQNDQQNKETDLVGGVMTPPYEAGSEM